MRSKVVASVALLAVSAAALAWILVGGRDKRTADPQVAASTATTTMIARRAKSPSPVLVAWRSGTLAQAVQDAASAPAGGNRVLLLGGLTPADTSSDAIVLAGPTGGHAVGRLPAALHDAAAARLGGSVYLFGGGNGTRQLDQILRVPRPGGSPVRVGRLPAPSSDQIGTAIGDTAYIVGGYTGTRWLDTIVAYRPGQPARVVAHLPYAVRYPAVTAVTNRLVVAGGSLENGTASDAVLEYVPGVAGVKRIGRLPAPTTHAAAAALGDTAYVIGGRGASTGTPTDQIVAVNLTTKRILNGGTLPTPLSDLAAVTIGRNVLVAGGRNVSRPQSGQRSCTSLGR